MCEVKPGPRCPADTRSVAGETQAAYDAAYPDGPPVDPLAAAAEEYRMAHRAPRDDGYGRPITRLMETDPDIYDHPEWYGSGDVDEETMRQLEAARRDPQAKVTIYRAAPPDVGQINDGDWVTLSRTYAEQHAMQSDDPSEDWPVMATQVPANQVFWDGNDLAEFGYTGPTVTP